jgi:hypothetical protein
MNHFANFLEKFKASLGKTASEKEAALDVIAKYCGYRPSLDQIEFKDGTLKLSLSPAFKSAIFLKKHLILDDLKQKNSTLLDIH